MPKSAHTFYYTAQNDASKYAGRVLGVGMEGTSYLPNRRLVRLYDLRILVRADFHARLHMIDGPETARRVMGVSRLDMARMISACYPHDGRKRRGAFNWRAVAGWESGDNDYRIGVDARLAFWDVIDTVVRELTGGQWRAVVRGVRVWRVQLRRLT